MKLLVGIAAGLRVERSSTVLPASDILYEVILKFVSAFVSKGTTTSRL